LYSCLTVTLNTTPPQFVLWFAGLRGAMSFALVENIPVYNHVTATGSRFKPELRACVTVCICVSVFLFGGMTHGLLTRMGFARGGEGEEDEDVKLSDVLGVGGGVNRRRYNMDREEGERVGRMSRSVSYDRVSGPNSELGLMEGMEDSEVSLMSADGLITDDGILGEGEGRAGLVMDDYMGGKGLRVKDNV